MHTFDRWDTISGMLKIISSAYPFCIVFPLSNVRRFKTAGFGTISVDKMHGPSGQNPSLKFLAWLYLLSAHIDKTYHSLGVRPLRCLFLVLSRSHIICCSISQNEVLSISNRYVLAESSNNDGKLHFIICFVVFYIGGK